MNEKTTFTKEVKSALENIKGEKKCCKKAREYAGVFLDNNAIIDKGIFKCDDCRGAFLRGVFLRCASVNSPEKENHLEFKLANEMNADELCVFIRECGFEAKESKRKNTYIVYFKDGETIFEFLSFICANKCAFEFLNTIIEKQIRNNCNRVTNCEYANMQKTANASARQLDAILKLSENGILETLPEKLLYTAKLKLDNPDMSLSELAAIHEPPITKSCANHRLERIIVFANGNK